jgi:hypothetical protein
MMLNKFYTVKGKEEDYTNIVIASNAKEAKKIGMNTEYTENVDFIDIEVKAIKTGHGFYQEEPEINFTIGGKGFVYTGFIPQLVHWEDFINELERQKRLIVDSGLFEGYNEKYDNDYFGIPKDEMTELQNKVDYDLFNFDEICEVYGVDVSKITFNQYEKLLNGDLNLPNIKKIQQGDTSNG